MADYYLHFSCMFDVGTAENAVAAIAIASEAADDPDSDDWCDSGFAIERDPQSGPGALWLRADEYGDPDRVVAFALRCAETFNLTGLWGFCWANSCSKPRLDAFGGGACLLDLTARREVANTNCADWLTDKMNLTAEIGEPSPEADKQPVGIIGHIPAVAVEPLYSLFRASSGHLTPDTWSWLDAQFGGGSVPGLADHTPTDLPGGRTQEGWFLYALEEVDDTIPTDLADVFQAARGLNADYVLLEPEGPVSSALPLLHPDFREELRDTTSREH